jgi:hypothetical protein
MKEALDYFYEVGLYGLLIYFISATAVILFLYFLFIRDKNKTTSKSPNKKDNIKAHWI